MPSIITVQETVKNLFANIKSNMLAEQGGAACRKIGYAVFQTGTKNNHAASQ